MEGPWAMWGQVVGCPLRDQRVSSTSVVLETTCSLTYPDSPKKRTCAKSLRDSQQIDLSYKPWMMMGPGGAHWLVLDSWSAAAAVTLPSSGFRTQNLVCYVFWFGWKNCSHVFWKKHMRQIWWQYRSVDVLYSDKSQTYLWQNTIKMHIWSHVHFLDDVCFPDSLHMQYSQLSSVVWYAFSVEQCWLVTTSRTRCIQLWDRYLILFVANTHFANLAATLSHICRDMLRLKHILLKRTSKVPSWCEHKACLMSLLISRI